MRNLVNQLDCLNLLLVVHTYKVCKFRNQKTPKLLSVRNKNEYYFSKHFSLYLGCGGTNPHSGLGNPG